MTVGVFDGRFGEVDSARMAASIGNSVAGSLSGGSTSREIEADRFLRRPSRMLREDEHADSAG